MPVHVKKAPRQAAGLFGIRLSGGLDLPDVGRLRPFLTLDDVKGDAVPFGERLEAIALNRREVHKHVRTVVLLDESKTLRVVKPLNRTFCHF